MNRPGKKLEWQAVLRLLGGAFCVLYVFSRFIPTHSLDEYPMVDSLENSWTQALHVAFLNRFQFGTEFVFTYGPWGFLARGYHPETFLIATGAWFVFTWIFLFCAWRVAKSISANWLPAGLWLMAVAMLMSIPAGEDINTRITGWCVLLLLMHFFVESCPFTLPQALLAVSLGWMSLIKFSGFAECLVVVAAIALDVVLRQRKFPWIVAAWAGGLVAFWVLAGQKISLLPAFFHHSWLVTGGYTEAMFLPERNGHWQAGVYVGLALWFCVIAFKSARTRLNIFGWLPVAAFAALLFINFKLGYVRSGWQHECTSALVLVLMALAGFALKIPSNCKYGHKLSAGLLVVSIIFSATVFGRWFPGEGLLLQSASSFRPANIFAPVAVFTSDFLRTRYEQHLARERSDCPLPRLEGTVDLYSYDQNLLFAHGLKYRPRPVIQSYSAYTPELAEMNAAHLRTPNAATNILFAIQPIDGRLPALDDALSWPELLARYEIVGTNGSFLRLKRSPVARTTRLTLVEESTFQMGTKYRLPPVDDNAVWVTIDVRPGVLGWMAATFYKPPQLKLILTFQDESAREFRLIPGMARSGFLLSPCVMETSDFATLMKGAAASLPAGKTVKAIAVTADNASVGGAGYGALVNVRFYKFEHGSSAAQN